MAFENVRRTDALCGVSEGTERECGKVIKANVLHVKSTKKEQSKIDL